MICCTDQESIRHEGRRSVNPRRPIPNNENGEQEPTEKLALRPIQNDETRE